MPVIKSRTHREMLVQLVRTVQSRGHMLDSASRCFPQEFTQSCLRHEAKLRPTAHDLLFHRVLFEVHSLKLLAAHCLINNQCEFLTSTRRAQRHQRSPPCDDIHLFLHAADHFIRRIYTIYICLFKHVKGQVVVIANIYSQQQQQQQTELLLYQSSPLTSRLVLCQQTCFQKTVWRRKPSPLTPTLSWQRSNTKTDREFSSSKKKNHTRASHLCWWTHVGPSAHFALPCCFLVSCRYSHVSPLELDKFLEDVKWVALQFVARFVSALWDCSIKLRIFSSLQERYLPPDEFRLVSASPRPPSPVVVSGAGGDSQDADSWTPGDRNQKG